MTVEAAVSESTQQSKAKVFISYSRKDMAFANQLEAALKARGFEPLIDRSEIYAFEEWWKRIEALIVRADTVVFVLSPDSVASEVALKEVTFAASLNKRFAPIVCRPVENKIVPEELVRLNFIFFDDAARFEDSTNRLAEALSTDIGWIRQHTEFGDLARGWALAKRPNGLLLRSPSLERAERWIASRPKGAPAPTDETQAFISLSRQAATRRIYWVGQRYAWPCSHSAQVEFGFHIRTTKLQSSACSAIAPSRRAKELLSSSTKSKVSLAGRHSYLGPRIRLPSIALMFFELFAKCRQFGKSLSSMPPARNSFASTVSTRTT
jgi:TIR domain-containing protein